MQPLFFYLNGVILVQITTMGFIRIKYAYIMGSSSGTVKLARPRESKGFRIAI